MALLDRYRQQVALLSEKSNPVAVAASAMAARI